MIPRLPEDDDARYDGEDEPPLQSAPEAVREAFEARHASLIAERPCFLT